MGSCRALCAALMCGAAVVAAVAGQAPPDAPGETIERGRYLAEHVAMCVECHTPRAEDGTLLRASLLRGAPVPVRSPFPNRPWALTAPNIAGLNGYTEEAGVRLLTEGIARTGKAPQPPMPPFRMTPEDARAIVAYLKSLP